jgi:transcriptional regulator with PAS, ATPase and Fis domain
MALPLQAKVLRVLQDKEVERLGSHEKRKADVRVVSATHQPLEDLMEKGLFREDLYYRLNVISVRLPPLRERPEDIILLSASFLEEFKNKYSKEIEGFSREVRDFFLRYSWPGNVRELRNLVESMVILTRKRVITNELLPDPLKEKGPRLAAPPFQPGGKEAFSLESGEKELIRQALEKTGGNRARAARILGIARSTLYNKMEKYGLA